MGATSSVSSYVSDQSHADNITGKIMVSAVIFLFIVVLFVLLLHLYAKWFWWRIEETTATPPPQRSHRRRRRFVFAPGQDPFIYGTHQNIGLDPSILKSIPVLVFQPEHFKDGLECAVCLSELVQGEKARLLPKCHHGFHVDCIDMWFHSHSTCPLCRNLVAYEPSIQNQNQNRSSSVRDNVSENISESLEVQNSADMNGLLESPNFPTNVLVWGNENQVSCADASSFEEGTSQQPPCSTSSTSSSGMLVIDIPSECSSSWCAEDEMKSPMTARLRSLKRLLSRDKKLIGSPNCSPSSMDNVEQAQS